MTHTATRSRNGRSASQRTPRRLSHRGVSAVAFTVAGLVLLAGHGHAGVAALVGVALYLLVNGCNARLAGSSTTARRALRALCWVAVAVAVTAAVQGSTAPGGATLGLALAAALATALGLTATRRG